MARIYLKRTLTGFAPADEPSREIWAKYKVGETYRGDVVKPRSYAHHKLIMSLLNLTYDNQEQYSDFESFRKSVAVEAGHTDDLVLLSGEIVKLPRSISYDELDEVEFTRVAGAMMSVCCKILKNIGADELEAEVSKYADEHYGQ